MANTIGWGKGTQNNSNGWGKFQNTIGAASIYEDSYSGETVLIGTSAAFSYSASSFHQGEADPTPTITGTTGGTFSATPSGLSINTSTGTIDLDNSTIQSYTITYTVSGVSANFNLAVTASPFVANNFSMQFDAASSQYVIAEIGELNNATALTFSGWVKKTSGNVIGFESFAGSTDRVILYWWSDNNVYWSVRNGSFSSAAKSALTNFDWNHIAGTFDGATNTIKLYINGSLVDTETGQPSSTSGNLASNFHIGLSNGSTYNTGFVDEVAIWNTALGETAIQEIYNATANNTGKVLDLNTDSGNYTSSANLQYWNRLGD